MRSDLYQIFLIVLGLIAASFFGVFLWREIDPEYLIYQNDYIKLEEFRSTYTGESPPPFSKGVKQILIEREDKGPSIIDRCTSCHVALEIPDFSATKIAYDINGNVILNEQGIPIQVPNENYIWAKLDEKINELEDQQVNAHLSSQGEKGKVKERLAQAKKLAALKIAYVDGDTYNVANVLNAHPLIGRETRPFEFHPIEEYGCTSCHNGNGRGLTTDKSHGPVLDGQYEIEYMGPAPEFLEKDPKNDPPFARMFNHKPGDKLVFQTTPIFIGGLIQAKCMQCHQSSEAMLLGAVDKAKDVTSNREERFKAIQKSVQNEYEALASLLELSVNIDEKGLTQTLEKLEKESNNLKLNQKDREKLSAQITYLKDAEGATSDQGQKAQTRALQKLNTQLSHILGSPKLIEELKKSFASEKSDNIEDFLKKFVEKHKQDSDATGSIFTKESSLNLENQILRHIKDTSSTFESTVSNPKVLSALQTDVDLLTIDYSRGKNLFISQACYACHRIAGLSRGGVGPELSNEGKSYPWFIKESIVWPQADLKTSTMPNYRLDHQELEPLVTFLLGQVGENKSVSDTAYKLSIQEWEAGKKLPWEKPATPEQIHDLRYSMTVFATEGCAACHRLKGFESNIGYQVEKNHKGKLDFETLYKEKEWFTKLFPEMIEGSEIVSAIDQHSQEIDQHIVDGVRSNSILEEIDQLLPEDIESFYSNFRYASRAKNDEYTTQANQEKDPLKKAKILAKLQEWKNRVHRVLMVYVQEYGLGRLIGPRPNWSGVYRSDEWLMEHFHKPSSHVARSIMPVFPFDETKFYALTYMLDELAKRNRDELREIWEHKGFNPELAYKTFCLQCHGETLAGNGPVSEWIYPIPKNLNNADFLRNLTKERVIYSISHGVKGTPMPPWGELPVEKFTGNGIPILKQEEIHQIADWLFSSVPGGSVIKESKDVMKWRYTPEDVLKELKDEGNKLKSGAPQESIERSFNVPKNDKKIGMDNGDELNHFLNPLKEKYYASLKPVALQDSDSGKEGKGINVKDVFDVVANSITDPDKYSYYIKKKYYTAENIEKGKEFFELNCAACHGSEADGFGPRAEVMHDAKPRMLIDLDWLKMRDDLRLLRSIKYGVPGTAMTPWGDLTSSLQRLQLVIFIRSLSQENILKDSLDTCLYKVFEDTKELIETSRIKEYQNIASLKEKLDKVKDRQALLFDKIKDGKGDPKEAAEVYQEQLSILTELKRDQGFDQILVKLRTLVDREKQIYAEIGSTLLTLKAEKEKLLDVYLKAIQSNPNEYFMEKERLHYFDDPDKEEEVKKTEKELVEILDKQIEELKKQEIIIEGKIYSQQISDELASIKAKMDALIKFKKELSSGFHDAVKLRQEQTELMKQYQTHWSDEKAAK